VQPLSQASRELICLGDTQKPPRIEIKTCFGCCGCDVLSVLCRGGLCAPLGWSGLPNRNAFRKLISENRGERIHKNSSENDRLPDGDMALMLFCKIKI